MPQRLFIVAAGLVGAAGVALSAAAAHAGGGNVGTAANFLLLHAPAFLAIGLLNAGRALQLAGLVLLLGSAARERPAGAWLSRWPAVSGRRTSRRRLDDRGVARHCDGWATASRALTALRRSSG